MHRITIVAALVLSISHVAFAQPTDRVMVVTVRVLSESEPATQFEISRAEVRAGAAPRPVSPELDAAAAAAGSPEIRLLDADGRVLHRQYFTWSRVLTVPPAPPGTTDTTTAGYVTLAQPEATILLPAIDGAARVDVIPASTTEPAAARSVTSITAAPPEGIALSPAVAPAPSQPGTFNLMLLASGFTAARLPVFQAVAAGIEAQMRNAEPFRSSGPRIALRLAQATGATGCAPGCSGIDRLMCCTNSAVINAATASGLPFDEIIVVHDTPTYSGSGGRDLGSFRTNSYNTFSVVYNGSWSEEMAQHEFGHSFGNLCDEYTYGNEPYRYNPCPNCRPACSDLTPFGPACTASCDAAPSYFRPENSVMHELNVPTFNNASIAMSSPVEGLSTRLQYFTTGGTPPATPTGLQAQATSDNLATLSWNAVATATSYTVQVGTASGQYTLFSGTVGNRTSVSERIAVGRYFWRVIAVNGAGSSAPSPEAQFTVGTPVTVPSTAPRNLRSQVNGSTVTLSWDGVAADSTLSAATGYIVQVGTSTGASNLFNGPVGNQTTVSGSVGNGSYFWRVIATNSAGSSPVSAEAQFTVGCTAAPGNPQNFTFTRSGRTVTLNWTAPASGGAPSQYVIEAGSASTLANLAVIPTASAALTMVAEAPPGAYYVRIRAQNACGTSAGASNEQFIVVP